MLKFFHFDKGMEPQLEVLPLTQLPSHDLGDCIWISIRCGFTIPATITFKRPHYDYDFYRLSLGLFQILVGLSLGAYSNLKKKAYVDAYTSHLGWLAIITGIILYVLGSMVLNISWIATIGSSIAIIAAVAIVVITVLSSENKWGGLASGLYNLYGISGYVADVVKLYAF